ncbi:MAG: hypothetical protein HOI47_25830 [Candidatus Scalindua sp.]|jgi:hypothetical protein|nr:hypothetical protein [Candidatus Scalindua sp.]MBT6230079.1 hypothetical protein [Candidatus Scalindua sp.]
MTRTNAIQKILSRNDTGETGGHQAGIHIHKKKEILSFFPVLNKEEKNPRIMITFTDSFEDKWSFSFIYYNNLFFNGTRNEYRLTGMTSFIKTHKLKAGDELSLARDENGFYAIYFSRKNVVQNISAGKLKLGNSWKVIGI